MFVMINLFYWKYIFLFFLKLKNINPNGELPSPPSKEKILLEDLNKHFNKVFPSPYGTYTPEIENISEQEQSDQEMSKAMTSINELVKKLSDMGINNSLLDTINDGYCNTVTDEEITDDQFIEMYLKEDDIPITVDEQVKELPKASAIIIFPETNKDGEENKK